ncbi:MAG: metalloregulator ArsR/SmtB family transcription factor [Acetobacteraceae bacterium]|nr:metalloregulator ArsR/SmtB family transcription factor [Acetobacteraceae bacterium]MCX7686181.1 metalloregulator ArsR/SmtB family transcription factor [Acetobacteraceae bacterium]MDW8398297.1 metalloregulator ArsR/SmtB family transcription factor [Acetobacteraceae bacterium]
MNAPATPPLSPADLDAMAAKAGEAAALLRALGSEHRLMLLCRLSAGGETSVGELAESLGLSQPGVSQHLARLRAEGIVAARRSGTTILYRLADPRAAALLRLLRDLHCPH